MQLAKIAESSICQRRRLIGDVPRADPKSHWFVSAVSEFVLHVEIVSLIFVDDPRLVVQQIEVVIDIANIGREPAAAPCLFPPCQR